MIVKVHPHKTLVNSGVEACVSVTPVKKHGRAYYMGTVMLRNGHFVIHTSGVKRAREEQRRNVHAWAVGDLITEHTIQMPLSTRALREMIQVTYHYNIGRFVEQMPKGVYGPARDVTDRTFKAAYFSGRDVYISKD